MSASKKSDSKTGTVHKKTQQQPMHQVDTEDSSKPSKPNFDEKDQGISPKRKAPGPTQRRRRGKDSARPEATPTPEANIKNDHDS